MSREDIKGAGGLASSATVTVLPAVLGGTTPLPLLLVLPPDDEDVEMAVACFDTKLELLELAAAEGFSKFDWALKRKSGHLRSY